MRRFALVAALAGAAAPAAASPGLPGASPQIQAIMVPGPKLLARYFVAVRPDASATGRVFRVRSKSFSNQKVTVIVRRVTNPGVVVAKTTGTINLVSQLSVTLPLNGGNTPVYCLTGEHHYQVSVWSGDGPALEALTLTTVPNTSLVACRGTRTAWFDPPGSYPNNVAPGAGAAGAPQAFTDCLEHEAAVAFNPMLRPGEDPWPDPDPGIAVNPDLNTCR